MCCGKKNTELRGSIPIAYDIDHECAVCFGIGGDASIKKTYYCDLCEEYICQACDKKWMKRGIAALRKKWFQYFKEK